MGYGFEIRQRNDKIIVDSDYANHFLKESGTVNLNGGNASGMVLTTVNTANTSIAPVFCFKMPTSTWVTFAGWRKTGTTFTHASMYAVAPVQISYRCYWANPVTAPAGYGIYCYDGSGNPTFNSNDTPLRVTATYTNSNASNQEGTLNTFTVRDAVNNWFMVKGASVAGRYEHVYPNSYVDSYFYISCFRRTAATTIQTRSSLLYSRRYTGFPTNFSGGGAFASAGGTTTIWEILP